MYFWRIRKLRTELTRKPLAEQESVKYLIGFTLFYFVVIFLHTLFSNQHRIVAAYFIYLTAFFALKVVGIYYCYQRNGGSKGHDFLSHYFSLGWVELVRFLVFGLIIAICGIFIIQLLMDFQKLEVLHAWWLVALALIGLIFYYWRLGEHMHWVVSRSFFLRTK